LQRTKEMQVHFSRKIVSAIFKTCFRQGLIFKDAKTLIESTGLYQKSVIQTLNLENMAILKTSKLDDKHFGEGCEIITLNGETEIYQLTWKEMKVYFLFSNKPMNFLVLCGMLTL